MFWLKERQLFVFCREDEPGWDVEIQDDVIDECKKHGGVVHIYVDRNSAQVSTIFLNLRCFDQNEVKMCFFVSF